MGLLTYALAAEAAYSAAYCLAYLPPQFALDFRHGFLWPLASLLLTPDGAAPCANLPSMPLATFLADTRNSALPALRAFSEPAPPEAPAAWVVGYAPRHSMPEKFNYILAPPVLLAHPETPLWLVRVARRNAFTDISTAFWTALEIRPVALDGSIGKALDLTPPSVTPGWKAAPCQGAPDGV